MALHTIKRRKMTSSQVNESDIGFDWTRLEDSDGILSHRITARSDGRIPLFPFSLN